MKTLRAVTTGFGHAAVSPALIGWLLLVSLLVALPNAMVIHRAVKDSVGSSLAHETLRHGFDLEWHSDYQYHASGVASLLTPTSVRPAAFLDNLEAWFNGDMFTRSPTLVALGVVYALLWSLMLGGILHKFAHHDRSFSLRSLLSRGAAYFFRFARLMALTGVAYYGVYRLSRWLFPKLADMMRDVTVEKTALGVNMAAAALILALLVLVKLISDYAKVATVLEERRSMFLAALHAFRFVLAHPIRTFWAYGIVALVGLAALALYAWIAPGQGQATLTGVLVAFMLAQLFLALRLVQRLTVYGAALETYRELSGD